MHWHERVEMVYVLKGKFIAYINGKEWEAQEGDIITIDTGLIHGFFNPGPDTFVRIFQFGLEIFDETLMEIRSRNSQGPVFSCRSLLSPSRDGMNYVRLTELLMGIFAEYQQKAPGYHLMIKSRLYEMAAIFLREIPVEESAARGGNKRNNTQYLERIFTVILANFTDPQFTLENGARDIGLSKYHLSRLLKEQTGQGFHDHLTRIRLRQAEKYLVESDKQVTDIAYLCGFQSLATFNRLFKSYTGASPSVYRSGKCTLLPYEQGRP
jgi:AraC-like DNA-binding protein